MLSARKRKRNARVDGAVKHFLIRDAVRQHRTSSARAASRAWKLKGSGPCFWVDARAVGFVGVNDDVLQVDLSEVKVVNSSLPGLAVNFANWLAADFLQSGTQVLKKSLSQESISLPSSDLAFRGLTFEMREPNTLSLGAQVNVGSPTPK